MKYAKEIISLMAAHPGRPFRFMHIVRFVHPHEMSPRTKAAVREGVRVALNALIETGVIRRKKDSVTRCINVYIWKKYQMQLTKVPEKVPE